MSAGDALDRLRQPEYTGENRCTPCTIVNAVIAVALAAGVAAIVFASGGDATVGAVAGGVVLFVSAAVIYLRGYLVPGTPWLTKTYFPDWVLRQFDKRPEPATDIDPDETVDPETVLVDAGALAECEDGDDLCLTDDFQTAWRDRIAAVRGDGEIDAAEVARMLGVDMGEVSVEDRGDAFVARVDGRRIGQWESRAAFLADEAAAALLRDRIDGWESTDVHRRSRVLHGLRLFLERCPACDAPVAFDEEVVESCCRSIDVFTVTCRDCDARVFEIESPT